MAKFRVNSLKQTRKSYPRKTRSLASDHCTISAPASEPHLCYAACPDSSHTTALFIASSSFSCFLSDICLFRVIAVVLLHVSSMQTYFSNPNKPCSISIVAPCIIFTQNRRFFDFHSLQLGLFEQTFSTAF